MQVSIDWVMTSSPTKLTTESTLSVDTRIDENSFEFRPASGLLLAEAASCGFGSDLIDSTISISLSSSIHKNTSRISDNLAEVPLSAISQAKKQSVVSRLVNGGKRLRSIVLLIWPMPSSSFRYWSGSLAETKRSWCGQKLIRRSG